MTLTVYVPAPWALLNMIQPRSGIVGRALDEAVVCIDYEGNLYEAEDLRSYEARVRQAAARHASKYPTIARAWVRPDTLIPVGTYDVDTKTLEITDQQTLQTWLEEER